MGEFIDILVQIPGAVFYTLGVFALLFNLHPKGWAFIKWLWRNFQESWNIYDRIYDVEMSLNRHIIDTELHIRGNNGTTTGS